MNYFAEYVRATGLTVKELVEMTGLSKTGIRNILKADDLSFVYKKTQFKIAKALNVSVLDLLEGGIAMKKKILETEIQKHAEAIAVALRKYSSEQLYCHVTLFTYDELINNDKTNVPDYVDIVVHDFDENEEIGTVISTANLVYHGDEGILKTEPVRNEVSRNDLSN